jgi:hypothetical protein
VNQNLNETKDSAFIGPKPKSTALYQTKAGRPDWSNADDELSNYIA